MLNYAACVRRFSPERGSGFTPIFTAERDESGFALGFSIGLQRLAAGAVIRQEARSETLWLLLHGTGHVRSREARHPVARSSVFEQGPVAWHVGAGDAFMIAAESDSEWAVVQVDGETALPARMYQNSDFTSEDSGAGLAQGACRRLVRTLFDYDTRPDSALVVGEVLNYPGRWSTYPPHHHPQPEVYHYRFTQPQGYGHAEIGETVWKVYDGDTIKIPPDHDHAQVSAPGYGMNYLWVIRHLPGRPYRGFTFRPEHEWLLDPRQQGWQPSVSEAS